MRGILLMLSALGCFSFLDAIAKSLHGEASLLQITAMRYLIATILMVLLLNPLKAREIFKTKKIGLQIFRSLILLGSTLINFAALKYLQLDQTMAILFTTPFFVAILAGPILGEWVGKFRWAAIGVGFIGVLIITEPWGKALHPAMLFSLGGALFYAIYSITTRILSKYDSTLTTVLHSNLWASLIIVVIAAPSWVWISNPFVWGKLIALGFCGGIGHWFMISAYRHAPASTLSPFIYMQMPLMILLSMVFFDQNPAINTLIGSGIIITSGLYMMWRERVRPIEKA
jgi:drug/metabolite transporter (DMT)-like permease